MAALGIGLSHRLYPVPFEYGRLVVLTAAALVLYALSLLAPSERVPGLAVKVALVAVFPALVLTAGVSDARRRRLGL
jgi:hypothetical protein